MPKKRYVICLDPGHGGSDSGAVGPTGVQEKIVALLVAIEVWRQLIRAGYEVFMTRDSDIDVSLGQRVQMANDIESDLFLSIHCNAYTDRTANGTETYHFPGSEAGKKLAGAIQFDLVAQLKRRDRGVRNANFAVLRETNMPAALVEIAFVSNPEEEGLLENSIFQVKAARAIVTGIARYLGLTMPTEDTLKPERMTPILGQTVASLNQARQFLRTRVPEWVLLADLYYTIAPKYGVRSDVAIAQACKETNYFHFSGLVQATQNNFAGLGATGSGNPGASFPDRAIGVEAHIQHLFAYATRASIPIGMTIVDPRFHFVQRGSAFFVEHLGAAENPTGVGWTYPGTDYGHSIVRDYLVPMLVMKPDDVVVPSWAKDAVMWAMTNRLVMDQSGSDEFYRVITILYRYDRLKK